VDLGELGGVGCSSGLIDRSVSGSLRSCLSSIATCHGDSCRFPVMGKGCALDQLGGPSLLTDSSSSVRGFLGKGVVRMGGIRGGQDDDATGGEGSVSGENSFHFPTTGRGMRSSEEGAVLLTGGDSMFCWVTGTGIGTDGGKGTLTGSGVSSIGTGGTYCSIDEYSCRCDPQGTRGSDGDIT